jgi:hypothetical protein
MKPAGANGGQDKTSNSLHDPKEQTVTAPAWGERQSQKIAWCAWLLETHPEVYQTFRTAADAKRAGNPDARIGVDNILQNLRWNTATRATGDIFKLNNNARALLGRLYLRERPGAKLETRRSWLDTLHPHEWQVILTALDNSSPLEPKGES